MMKEGRGRPGLAPASRRSGRSNHVVAGRTVEAARLAKGRLPCEGGSRPRWLTMMATKARRTAPGLRHRSHDNRHSRRDSKASDDKGVTMRFGHLRGVMLAVALVSSMATGRSASADGFRYTMPREVLARDLNTGEPYFAPPDPLGPLRQGRPLRPLLSQALRDLRAPARQGRGLLRRAWPVQPRRPRAAARRVAATAARASSTTARTAATTRAAASSTAGAATAGGSRTAASARARAAGSASRAWSATRSTRSPPSRHAPAKVVVTSPQAAPDRLVAGLHRPRLQARQGAPPRRRLDDGRPLRRLRRQGLRPLRRPRPAVRPRRRLRPLRWLRRQGLRPLRRQGQEVRRLRRQGLPPLLPAMKGKLFGLLHPHAGDIKYFVGPGGPVPLTPGLRALRRPDPLPPRLPGLPPLHPGRVLI